MQPAAHKACEGQAASFEQFWETNGRAPYTTVFHSHLDARIHDIRFGLAQRVLDWIIRRSWAYQSNLALTAPNGKPATQAHCARELNVTRGAVSKAIAALRQAGYLERRKDDLLVPLRVPAEPSDGGPEPSPAGQKTWKDFLGEWRSVDPDLVRELEEAEAKERAARQRLMKAFRKWKANNTHVSTTETPTLNVSTTETPTLASTAETPSGLEQLTAAETERFRPQQQNGDASLYARTEEHNNPASSSSEPRPTTPEETNDLAAALLQHGIVADAEALQQLARSVRAIAPDATTYEIVWAIHARGPQLQRARNPIGLALTAVPKLFSGPQPWRDELRRQQQRAAEAQALREQENITIAREILADPHTWPATEVEWAREVIRRLQPDRQEQPA